MKTANITCLIVDDEPLAVALLKSYVEKTPFLDLKATFNNAFHVLDFIGKTPVDLLFLDIQMPGLSGIELSKVIQGDTRVIFTTAFDKYAVEGYKVEALDYLLKPFNYEEFLKAATKAKRWFDLTKQSQPTITSSEAPFIFVRAEYKLIKIILQDILYIEGLKDYVKIYVKNDSKPILTLSSLKAMEEKLPEGQFMRIHRSYIVNLHHISAVEKSQVLVADKYITVADSYKEGFERYIS